jgi:hypothetical protein
MIPAYSPQARGRCERNFGTWQNRLPQELRLAGIATLEQEQANAFLRQHYIAAFNRKFAKPAFEKGTAFRKCGRKDLDCVSISEMSSRNEINSFNNIGNGREVPGGSRSADPLLPQDYRSN